MDPLITVLLRCKLSASIRVIGLHSPLLWANDRLWRELIRGHQHTLHEVFLLIASRGHHALFIYLWKKVIVYGGVTMMKEHRSLWEGFEKAYLAGHKRSAWLLLELDPEWMYRYYERLFKKDPRTVKESKLIVGKIMKLKHAVNEHRFDDFSSIAAPLELLASIAARCTSLSFLKLFAKTYGLEGKHELLLALCNASRTDVLRVLIDTEPILPRHSDWRTLKTGIQFDRFDLLQRLKITEVEDGREYTNIIYIVTDLISTPHQGYPLELLFNSIHKYPLYESLLEELTIKLSPEARVRVKQRWLDRGYEYLLSRFASHWNDCKNTYHYSK